MHFVPRTWLFGIAACSVALSLGCGSDPVGRGALVVRLESDLALPKDLDLVRIRVTRDGKELFANERDVFDAQSLQFEVTIRYDGSTEPVQVVATGYRRGAARVERVAITQLPRTQKKLLRMPLDALCAGELSCEDDETCDVGSCTSAVIKTESLLDYGQPETGGKTGADNGCMDVALCFAEAKAPKVDRTACTFAISDDVDENALNVALKFPSGGSGVCGADGCFVPLDAGDDGWSLIEGSVQLPARVCREGAPFSVVVSSSCATKTRATSICSRSDAVSGVSDAGESESTVRVPPAIGTACAPPASESCGMCGTRTRTCEGGAWSEWSECSRAGVCEPNAQSSCDNGGTRVCGTDCQWGECEGQRCDGPATQSCGNCGTQHRTCTNGKWSDWGICDEQGACTPNAVENCEPGQGARVCGGNCQWDICTVQQCAGVGSRACDKCGTQRRTCDGASGTWSGWGPCVEQGDCEPNDMQDCGEQGHNTCSGSCKWDTVCRDQVCPGAKSKACGNCGTQTRTCDSNSGEWSDYGECTNQRDCTPNDTEACGSGGTRTCDSSCRWSGECTGQSCSGERQRSCERCGTQTRACNSDTGGWGEWSTCMNQGACAVGDMQPCGSGGVQYCGNDCKWQTACIGQMCNQPLEQGCPKCGTQKRDCDPNTGKVSEWSACLNQLECEPTDVDACGETGKKTCSSACHWGDCDCGTGSRLCGDRCANLQTDRNNCGACGAACRTDETCKAGKCEVVCADAARCGPNQQCVDLLNDSANCGRCGNTCAAGTACKMGACDCGRLTRCGNACVDLTTDTANCGDCGNLCTTGTACKAGACDCGALTRCGSECVDLANDPDNCGACDNACMGRSECFNAKCASSGTGGAGAGGAGSSGAGAGGAGSGGAGSSGAGAGGAGAGGAGAGGAGSGGAGASGGGSGGAGTGGAGAGGAGSGSAGAGGAGSGGAGAGGAGSGGAGAPAPPVIR